MRLTNLSITRITRKYGIITFIILCKIITGQNVGINSTGASPAASTILDLNTGNTFTSPKGKGLLIPNVSLTSITDVTTVASPAISLLIYNTATAGTSPNNVIPGFYYFNGTNWTRLQSSTSTSQDWSSIGNAGTNASSNFIGTTDANDLVFKTNNTENLRIQNSTGYVGINTSNPTTNLQINGAITGAIKIVDGNQSAGKVLTSDVNGLATWQDNSSVLYTGSWVNTYSSTPLSNSLSSPTYCGLSVTLPSGKYLVTAQFGFDRTSSNSPSWRYVSYSTTSTNPATAIGTRFVGGVGSAPGYVEDYVHYVTWVIDLTAVSGNTTVYFFQADTQQSPVGAVKTAAYTDQYSVTAILLR